MVPAPHTDLEAAAPAEVEEPRVSMVRCVGASDWFCFKCADGSRQVDGTSVLKNCRGSSASSVDAAFWLAAASSPGQGVGWSLVKGLGLWDLVFRGRAEASHVASAAISVTERAPL